ncbi:hypothetical protein PBY51_002437 [Eleginops maclovinus]|uniref:Uncharacterized protein n=1 Tax=Eleginops maclovinus TaxID=56733 RepID=A0AAN8AJC8_ELEMC|nr:hypothetical protein PBY51_002437 [Eleginops maclovinus]
MAAALNGGDGWGLEGGIRGLFGPGREEKARGRRVDQHRRGRRPDDGVRRGGGGGGVDPSKSLGSFSKAQIITSVRGTRAVLGGEPPRRGPSLGAIFQKKVTWERNNRRWENKEEGGSAGELKSCGFFSSMPLVLPGLSLSVFLPPILSSPGSVFLADKAIWRHRLAG